LLRIASELLLLLPDEDMIDCKLLLELELELELF
jgi:hypothetical protein